MVSSIFSMRNLSVITFITPLFTMCSQADTSPNPIFRLTTSSTKLTGKEAQKIFRDARKANENALEIKAAIESQKGQVGLQKKSLAERTASQQPTFSTTVANQDSVKST
jgi:hypothetical protein